MGDYFGRKLFFLVIFFSGWGIYISEILMLKWIAWK